MEEGLVQRKGLLQMIPPNIQALKVLVVESLFYLPELCGLMPNAHISVVTSFEEILDVKGYENLPVDWHFLDFRTEQLPFEDGCFHLALAEPCLTMAYAPYETLSDISRLLKDTGYLITEYRNIRYWRILEKIRRGCYHEREERLYSKEEIVRLMNDAIFKELSFAPLELREDEEIREKAWEEMGFSNFRQDLGVEVWMVKAGRSTAAVANLKSFFTFEVRAELAKLLHRIEYDVDREENLARLWALCRRAGIFEDYFWDFAQEIILHSEVIEILHASAEEQGGLS